MFLRHFVLPGSVCRCKSAKLENRIELGIVETEVLGTIDSITGILGNYRVRRIVLTVLKSGETENTVAVSASGVSTEGDGEQLQGVFPLVEVEAIDAPEHLILAERCREDCSRRRDGIGGSERSEPAVAIRVDIYI